MDVSLLSPKPIHRALFAIFVAAQFNNTRDRNYTMGVERLTWSEMFSGIAEVFFGARREGCNVSEFLERQNDRTSLSLNDLLPPHLKKSPEQMAHMLRCQSTQPRHICGPVCGMPES